MANLPTISMVDASDPHSLADASQRLHTGIEGVRELGRLGKIAQEAAEHLRGDGEEARLVRAMGEHLSAREQLQQFDQIAANLGQWGGELAALQAKVRNLVEEAKEHGFAVHDNGDVEGPADKAADHDHYVQAIHEALMEYATYDETAAYWLRRMAGQLKALGEGTSSSVVLAETAQAAARRARDDANAINRGDLSEAERQRIEADLEAHGLTSAQTQAVLEGRDTRPPLSPEQSAYMKTFLGIVDRDALLRQYTSPARAGRAPLCQALDRDGALSGMILAGTSPRTVFSDGSRGGRDVPNQSLRAPQRMDARTAADLDDLATVLGGAKPEAMFGSQLTYDMLAKTSEYAKAMRDGHWAGGYNPGEADAARLERALQVAGRDHVSMTNLLTGDANGDGHPDSKRGAEASEGLLTYKWPDKGAALASAISWIHGDAEVGAKGDPVEEQRATVAGRAAAALADLTTRANEADGGPNLYKQLMNNPNPEFARALGDAMVPYLGVFGEAPHGGENVRGFALVDGLGQRDQRTMLFSVIDADDQAARRFNAKAEIYAQALQQDYADSLLEHERTGAPVRTSSEIAAMQLQGLMEAGADAEAGHRYGYEKEQAEARHKRMDSILGGLEEVANSALGKLPIGQTGSFVLKHLEDELNKEINPSVATPETNPRVDYRAAHSYQADVYNLVTELKTQGVPLPPGLADYYQHSLYPGRRGFDPGFLTCMDEAIQFLKDHGVDVALLPNQKTETEVESKETKSYEEHRR
ncbi:hypothetical protein HMPREF9336_01628 [Segniliparus rugosus ATCC BAA-974]|uniref:TPR repeat domain-containing protein n=2 Tax=Segniliparus rugosus TaxID=286804 RepID=E5XQ56_SEGRC|nr:hypothetical protein HMPREF9336_01628 [Segniliparus rugosus ATCC BAA-974]